MIMKMKDIDPNIIDWDVAVQQANGKNSLAIDMLHMLIESLPGHKAALKSAFEAKDFVAFHEEVHKLYGALCYCGTPRLKKAAKELDQTLQNNQKTTIDKLYHQLNIEIESLKKVYKQIDFENIQD